jgi:hypothetical protein
MTAEQIGGIVRALMAAIGGWLIAKGVLDEGAVEAVSGAVATLVSAVWSVAAKKPKKAE